MEEIRKFQKDREEERTALANEMNDTQVRTWVALSVLRTVLMEYCAL